MGFVWFVLFFVPRTHLSCSIYMPGQKNYPRNQYLLKREALRLVSGTKLACS